MSSEMQSKLSWKSQDNPPEINAMLTTLSAEYPLCDGGKGLKLKFRKIESSDVVCNVIRSRGEVLIEYTSVAAAARGVGAALSKQEGNYSTSFTSLGIMLDVSRNMVMRVEHFKKWLRVLALSGYNQVLIYAEDTYEMEDQPWFGAYRGAYTMEELQELDDYAVTLGIELVGCIQTLAHMEQILRHPPYTKLADSERVMMPGDPDVLALVEKMMQFWSKALRSRRIHIGMDEAHGMGRGKYQTKFGPNNPFDLMTDHLKKVSAICKEYGLAPMIWSDMFFRLAAANHGYYEPEAVFPAGLREQIDPDCQLVYWDYYHEDEKMYADMIRRHRDLGKEPVVASGIWTWVRMWYDHQRTMNTATPCINVCRREKVRELFFTMWGDNGAYCEYDSALAGIVRCGDLAYGVEDEHLTAKRFDAVCMADYGAQIAASEMHCAEVIPSTDKALRAVLPQNILWDDPLLGIIFDNARRSQPEFDLALLDIYDNILCRIMPFVEEDNAGSIAYAVALLKFLSLKIQLRGALEAAYDSGDRLALRELASTTIPAAITALYEFDAEMRRCWLKRSKPFGLERLQVRNAGQAARLEELALRIREYLEGDIDTIEELDARLPWSAETPYYVNYAQYTSGSVII